MDNDNAEKIVHDNLIRFGKMITKGSILIEGLIKAVDEISYTCDVIIQSQNPDGSTTDTTVPNVPIKVLIGSQASLIEIPQVGSNCTINFRDNNIQRPQLYQVDQCNKILIKIGDSTLQVDSTGFIFNGGSLNGMVKVDSNVDRLNKIEDDVNSLKTAIAGWTPVSGDGGAALKTATAAWFGNHLTKTVKADIENTKIKQ